MGDVGGAPADRRGTAALAAAVLFLGAAGLCSALALANAPVGPSSYTSALTRLRPLVEDDWIVGPWVDTLRRHPAFGRRLADSGREIHVWTVNTEADLQVCLDLGVRAVITDRPGFVLDLLDG